MCREASIRGKRNWTLGSRTAERSALLDEMLSTVHAGDEQCWESGHLEPFSFLSPPTAQAKLAARFAAT